MNRRSQAGLVGLVSLALLCAGCATKNVRTQLDDTTLRLQQTDRALRDLEVRACELEATLGETEVAYDETVRENRELAAALLAERAKLAEREQAQRDEVAALRADSDDREKAAAARAELAGAKLALYEREVGDRDAKLDLKETQVLELERSIAALESNALANGETIDALSGEKAALSAELEAAVGSRTKVVALLAVLLAFFVALSIAEFVAVRRARHAHV